MMKKLILYCGKKYVISAINDLLERHKDNVTYITMIVEDWIVRLQVIIEQLKKINYRLTDSKIDQDEIDETVAEIEQIITEWK